MLERVLLVGLGGAVGSILRYVIGVLAAPWSASFPYGTLAVNLLGALAIGLVNQLAVGHALLSETTRVLLTAGFLGGFTTYSAFAYETVRLAQTGAWMQAGLNATLTTAGCFLLTAVGMALGRMLLEGRP